MSLAGRTKTEILDRFRISQCQLDLSEERIEKLEAELRAARDALKAWEFWYSEDSSEFNREVARDMGLKAISQPTLAIQQERDTLRAIAGELRDAWRDWSFPVDRSGSEPLFIDSLKAKKLDLLARAEAVLNQKEPA